MTHASKQPTGKQWRSISLTNHVLERMQQHVGPGHLYRSVSDLVTTLFNAAYPTPELQAAAHVGQHGPTPDLRCACGQPVRFTALARYQCSCGRQWTATPRKTDPANDGAADHGDGGDADDEGG